MIETLTNYIQSFNMLDMLQNNLLIGFLASYFLGFLTALTPCVWPMYPITASIIVNSTSSKSSTINNFFLTLIYILGMTLMFAIIGLLSGIFGAQVQSIIRSPYVTIGIGLIFIILALSLFGLFEIQLPYFIRKRFGQGGGLNKKRGLVGLFSLGALSGVIASPCTLAPLAAIIIFITQTGNAFLGFLLLSVFGFGIGTPLLIVGTLSGRASKLPKSGKWMYILQYSLGVILIGVGLYFIVPSIKIIQQSSKTTTSSQNSEKKDNSNFILNEEKDSNVTCDSKTGICHLKKSDNTNQKVNSNDYWSNITKMNQLDTLYKYKKPFILKFTAAWCEYCKKMEDETLTKMDFIDKTDGINLIFFDGTKPDDDGNKILKKYSVPGFPTFVFFNGEKDTIFYGYHDKKNFEKIVDNFFSKYFKKRQFLIE